MYKGCFDPLISKRNVPNPFFGIDGFGDTKYETHPDMTLLKEEHGVNAIYRIAKEVKSDYLVSINMYCKKIYLISPISVSVQKNNDDVHRTTYKSSNGCQNVSGHCRLN